jgi:prepilin-type N-terminal cleavage/methylation domain-containing protein
VLGRSGSPLARRSRLGERGVSLIEIMIALSILSVVLLALGGLMFEVARHTRRSTAVSYRSAALESAASWVQALPWDSLPTSTGCTDSLTAGAFMYSRCFELVSTTPNSRLARVIISPTGALQARPDTVTIERTKSRASSPFTL